MALNLPTCIRVGEKQAFASSKTTLSLKCCLIILCFLAVQTGFAQMPLIADGQLHDVNFNGTYQDFTIPNDPTITQISFAAKGGDGGFARIRNFVPIPLLPDIDVTCKVDGGEGASVLATFYLGNGPGELPYGSTIRMIVGGKGESGNAEIFGGTSARYGGGGGGTGILIKKPGSDTWEILLVAGGGGGAYQGMGALICVNSNPGEGGRRELNGGRGGGGIARGDGGIAGKGGDAGGVNNLEISGGGGGAFTPGQGVTCLSLPIDVSEVGQGQSGLTEGGAGGKSNGCIGFNMRDGGFGFGGGGAGFGAGGGGGGYSGGGGGGTTGSGGGGGSFVTPMTPIRTITPGNTTPEPADGWIQYQLTRPPMANCTPDTISIVLDELGFATVRPADIDNGSSGPEGFTRQLSPGSFTCADLGLQEVTLTITDPATNAIDQCTTIVNVIDNTAPTLICPEDITVEALPGDDGARIDFADQVTINDNCNASLVLEPASGSVFPIGVTTVTATATDAAGNTTTCTFNVTVEKALEIICPGDREISCNASTDPLSTGFAFVTGNAFFGELTLDDAITSGTCPDDYTIRRRWIATDSEGNADTCFQTIRVLPDTEAPMCLNCPEDITVSCDALPSFEPILAADNCDPEPSIAILETTTQTTDGSCSDFQYVRTRLITITDRCGNAFEHTQVITVIDNVAPVIECPAAITVPCNSEDQLELTGMPTVTDNCDPAPSLSYKDEYVAGDCDYECTIERTWIATDVCGNTATCVQIITRTSFSGLEQLLAEAPIQLGRDLPYSDASDNLLTIGPDAAKCIISWLPSAGTQSSVIPNGNYVVDGEHCLPYANMLDENGKLVNPLLAEMIELAVNLRLNPDMANMPLSEIPCMAEAHPVIYQYMRGTPTIGKMYEVGNNSVGNVYGPAHLRLFTEAIRCINSVFNLCDDGSSEAALANELTEKNLLGYNLSESEATGLKIYPNPNSGTFHLDLSAFADQSVLVRVFSAQGKLIRESKWNAAPASPVAFELNDQPGGVYFVSAVLDGKDIRTSKVILKK